jgi:hypothetical protein
MNHMEPSSRMNTTAVPAKAVFIHKLALGPKIATAAPRNTFVDRESFNGVFGARFPQL